MTIAGTGPQLQDELHRWAVSPDPALASAAAELLAALPRAAGGGLRIQVFGPLTVERDGRPARPGGLGPSAGSELRRRRVRQLLGLLVLERRLTRRRAADLLWPDLPAGRATHNLRVTLTHLRRLLDPEPVNGPKLLNGPKLVNGEAEVLRLAGPPHLEVDLWQFEALVDRANRLRAQHRPETAVAAYQEALHLWRDDPLPDLHRTGATAMLERLFDQRRAALLALGALLLDLGRAGEAIGLSEQAVLACPFDERAHRLALAARLQIGDLPGARTVRRRLNLALANLGCPPEPATAVLLRRAERLLRG